MPLTRIAAALAGMALVLGARLEPAVAGDFQILEDQDLPGHDLRTPVQDGKLKGITLDQCRLRERQGRS